jgi:hypothetical protein
MGAIPGLSAATRQASEENQVLPLTLENLQTVAALHTGTPVRQKIRKVLEYIARKSQYPGDAIDLVLNLDYPAFDAVSSEECTFLVRHVFLAGYLEKREDKKHELSVKGWQEIEPAGIGAGIPNRCFVAMSFSDELDGAYQLGIKPAIEQDCGYIAVRMKELHHNQDICDRLLSEIRRAQFVVADFTLHRNGVYYEAGFARALGREVINCCRDTDFAKLHFDTNHLSHLQWSTAGDLREKLADRIRATILT